MSLKTGFRGEGFCFDNVGRNVALNSSERPQQQLPKAMKTGTTIVGVVYEDGVVLAADTRATEGTVVADKQCQKIHYMAPNIMCCGAGTAADTENVTMMVCSELTLHRLETRKQSRVIEALTMLKRHLFQYQGHISAALVLGGVDADGPFLGTIAPHGSTDRLPFVAMGSGSLAAMAMLESGYKDHMNVDEAKRLVTAAITAGIFNDPFSGTQVDVCVITKTDVKFTYGHFQPFADKPAPVECEWKTTETFIPAEMRKPAHPPTSMTRPTERLVFLPAGTTPIKKETIRQLVTIQDVPVTRD